MRRRIDRLVPLLALPLLMQATLVHAQSCEETLKVIEEVYNNQASNCMSFEGDRSVRTPASDCSGLIVRGTQRPERQDTPQPPGTYHVWNTSPKAQNLGTTAASWMRSDIKYVTPGVDRHNGFLLFPPHYTETRFAPVFLNCAYPLDGFTDSRNENGCGDNSVTPGNVEKSCAQEGVNGGNWKASEFDGWQDFDPERNRSLCSFDMRGLSDEQRTDVFQQFMQARKSIEGTTAGFASQTEVRYSNTEQDKAPVMAFFYSEETGTNIEDAWKNAEEYEQVTGIKRPVVKIDFPKTSEGKAVFSCPAKPDPTPDPETIEPVQPVDGSGTGADPTQCSQYIESVQWISRRDPGFNKEIMSLSVTPTTCGRKIGADQTEKLIAEMKEKALAEKDGDKLWGDRDLTMRRQAVCHLTLTGKDEKGVDYAVRTKEQWNLEPIRPYVPQAQAIKDKCNPMIVDEVEPVGGYGPNGSKQCSQYVHSVEWVMRYDPGFKQDVRTLSVVPSKCGRAIGPDQTEKLMAEIKDKALAADKNGKKYWGDRSDSMRRQTICHMTLVHGNYSVRNKAEWNLEPDRPNGVSQKQAEEDRCNFTTKRY